MNDINLKDKKIIIAGSEGLLGNEIACYFEENGNDVLNVAQMMLNLQNPQIESVKTLLSKRFKTLSSLSSTSKLTSEILLRRILKPAELFDFTMSMSTQLF